MRVKLVMYASTVPVLVKITFCAPVELPTGWLPNARLPAESDSDDAAAVIPVPLTATMACGEPLTLSIKVTVAAKPPMITGAKRTPILQLEPAAKIVPQTFDVTNDVALAPVSLRLPIDIAAPPVLVKIILCDPVELPTGSVLNDKLVADSDICAEVMSPVGAEMLEPSLSSPG